MNPFDWIKRQYNKFRYQENELTDEWLEYINGLAGESQKPNYKPAVAIVVGGAFAYWLLSR